MIRKIIDSFTLCSRLSKCKHKNISFPDERLIVCWQCGSTKRPEESMWSAPWAWRDLL